MTDTPMQTDVITAYRASVERHLADLLDEILHDITAGLRAHLAEIATQLLPGETLEHRLGSPEQCASSALGYSPPLTYLEEQYLSETGHTSMRDASLTPAVPRRAAP